MRLPVVGDAGKQRRQPVGHALAVSVQDDDDLTGGDLGADHASLDKTHTLVGTHEFDRAVEALDVLFELLLEKFYRTKGKGKTTFQSSMWCGVGN